MSSSVSLEVLLQPVDRLSSVGPKRAAALAQVGVFTIEELLYYLPRRYLDRTNVTPINQLREDEPATVIGRIIETGIKKGGKTRFYLVLKDDTGLLVCVWFAGIPIWQRLFAVGEWLAVSGKPSRYGGLQMVHPEFDRLGRNLEVSPIHTGRIVPVYPSTEGLTDVGLDSRGFRRLMARLVKDFCGDLADPLPAALRARHDLPPLGEALRQVHLPNSFESLQCALRRLKFDELFFLQLLLALRRRRYAVQGGGTAFTHIGEKVKALSAALPFELTEAQKRVLHEIRADLRSSRPMNRLLQGDVGSGKTLVALFAMLMAVDNDCQAAIMAPTEILAEQHYLTLRSLLQGIDVHLALLIGGQKKSERERVIREIADGTAQIVVGTHALIQEHVEFSRLGLVVIDEQHRFGVMQRAALREKGLQPHLLVMTATPIPRTLTMTLYGDLDVSLLDQLPAGRKPIITRWRDEKSRRKIYEYVRQKVESGEQAYIVFPLVEESEKLDLKAATESYEIMRKTFFQSFSLGLLHGRMSAEEKAQVMDDFKSGRVQILVSTTVIEVGVDVPNATIMVIEHAERFGLSQLHQLRGRVGRGSRQSYCILIAYGNLSAEARERLETMAATNDGFKIAEKDLQLRGPGDYFGTQQSGMPNLKVADILRDGDLLTCAREEAAALVERDPQLSAPEDLPIRGYFSRKYRNYYQLCWIS
ncbi:MAG: ATP-dependent DNA helicase RecG [candidate division KSB1 bacterium]|nr:ATP-dependent DNA helicase RecG [candidate division KSB1 bacterium]